jgi:hypothetical protein
MEREGLSLLGEQKYMTIATVCAEGWPQASTVAYVNERFNVYFLISRTSRKFKNMTADGRVSIAVRSDVTIPSMIKGLSMSARAYEVRDEPYRSRILSKLSMRHPGFFDVKTIDFSTSALFQATPIIVSIIDYAQSLGHADILTVGADGLVEMTANQPDNWGPNPAPQLH